MSAPARDAAARERLTVRTEDGVALAVDHLPAQGAKRGAVLLGHAILANRRSLDRPRGAGLASELAASGFEVYVADFRGHGDSGTKDGSWRYDDLVRFDMPALSKLVHVRHQDLPVAGVGHSLAGHVTLAWLGTRGPAALDAVVTLGANVWLPRFEPVFPRLLEKRATFAAMTLLALPFGRFPARALGIGSDDLPASFVREWRRSIRRDEWRGAEGEDYLEALSRVRAPVLAIFGAGDRLLCPPVCGELFHRRLSRAPVEMWVAGKGDSLPFDPGHMALVTDARARPLWRKVASWLATALGGGERA